MPSALWPLCGTSGTAATLGDRVFGRMRERVRSKSRGAESVAKKCGHPPLTPPIEGRGIMYSHNPPHRREGDFRLFHYLCTITFVPLRLSHHVWSITWFVSIGPEIVFLLFQLHAFNDHRFCRHVLVRADSGGLHLADLVHNVHAVDDLAENGIPEPFGRIALVV